MAIRFSLVCEHGHEFEGWFRSGGDFEAQNGRRLVQCAVCGSQSISKALMAPAVSTARAREKMLGTGAAETAAAMMKLRELAKEAIAGCEDVGDRFAEEARKIHYGEADNRGIKGEADLEEVAELLDEGIVILPVPVFPDDRN